jgi:RNA polymerase sigma-70 factor, ECF subfamily
MDSQELDQLAIAAQGGDREAFRLLFLETHRSVRLCIAAQAASREQVDEILQATYVAAFEHLAQYRPTQTLRAWLMAIARNQLTDRWRENRRFSALNNAAVDEMLAVEVVDELENEEAAEAGRAMTARLALCLERLPSNARAMLDRRYREGLPLAELARRFRRTTEAIGIALFRIRQGLRQCLEGRVEKRLEDQP